jgi:hypothetical protein
LYNVTAANTGRTEETNSRARNPPWRYRAQFLSIEWPYSHLVASLDPP